MEDGFRRVAGHCPYLTDGFGFGFGLSGFGGFGGLPGFGGDMC
jgi:hypothetical protein